MIIPLRTSRPPKRPPVITGGLLIVNMLAYLACLVGARFGDSTVEDIINGFALSRTAPFWTYVTYLFMHDPSAVWHLLFNMLFLWVFGSAVEGRLGRLSFLAFYLIGGAMAGGAQLILDPATSVIGASGAVAALTGAFLALFPRAHIRILVFFFIIGLYDIPAIWLIGFYFAMDFVNAFFPGRGVAYGAHLAGYVYGFTLSVALLGAGVLKREELDVFYLFQQWRRRVAFRRANRTSSGGMIERPVGAAAAGPSAKKSGRGEPAPDPTAAPRADIVELLVNHRTRAAAEAYATLLRQHPDAVLNEAHQLDVANQLHADGQFETAARAYERLLECYPSCANAGEVRLLLAVLLVRRLNRAADARPYIEGALRVFREGEQRVLADQLLSEMEAGS